MVVVAEPKMHRQTHYPLVSQLGQWGVTPVAAKTMLATQGWLLTKQNWVENGNWNVKLFENGLHLSPLIHLNVVLNIRISISSD